MCMKEEIITQNSYKEKIQEVVNDYMNNIIPSLDFEELDEDTQKELTALYSFSNGVRREVAESILVDILTDEIDSWISIFMWGALRSMGYEEKYAVKAHSEMFGLYMRCLSKYIQNDIDYCHSTVSDYSDDDFFDRVAEAFKDR